MNINHRSADITRSGFGGAAANSIGLAYGGGAGWDRTVADQLSLPAPILNPSSPLHDDTRAPGENAGFPIDPTAVSWPTVAGQTICSTPTGQGIGGEGAAALSTPGVDVDRPWGACLQARGGDHLPQQGLWTDRPFPFYETTGAGQPHFGGADLLPDPWLPIRELPADAGRRSSHGEQPRR